MEIVMQTISETVSGSMASFWSKIAGFVPELLAAVVVALVGVIIAKVIAKIVQRGLQFTEIDRVGEKTGLQKYFSGKGVRFSLSNSIAFLVKWFFILAFFVAAIDILGIPQLSSFVNSIISYIPNVILAIAILSIGLIVAQYASDIIKRAVQFSRMLKDYASEIGMLTYGAIVAFTLMATLIQLGIAASLINILFAGLIGMLTLAGGLAFGLGGRESAAKMMNRFQIETADSDELYLTKETQETMIEDVPNCLLGMEYPANKKEVVKYCKDRKAKNLLRNLDEKNYFSLSDIISGLKKSFF